MKTSKQHIATQTDLFFHWFLRFSYLFATLFTPLPVRKMTSMPRFLWFFLRWFGAPGAHGAHVTSEVLEELKTISGSKVPVAGFAGFAEGGG